MNKDRLNIGKKYIRKRKVFIDNIPREAECFLRGEEVNCRGAVFSRYFEPPIALTNDEIEKELRETI